MRHDCTKCKHENSEVCDDCSNISGEGCSCHLNPPCGYCVDNHFEEKEK